jgi:pimeloyl-ACP methyl ester carboxylesterase
MMPRGWERGLDRAGMIYVSAGNSGNEQGILPRRVPLALTAAANVMKRFPIDPAHVYVGGFSGGSRVAERLALAYPDIFRGALLNAGSDRINDTGLPLPPESLLKLFQETSRLVFVTGERDTVNIMLDMDSMRSLEENCVFNFVSQSAPWLGHAVLPSGSFDAALTALSEPVSPDSAKLEECRTKKAAH